MKNKNRKNLTFINTICVSRGKGLVGGDRLNRMAEAASYGDAIGVLRESAFGGDFDGSQPFDDYDALVKKEECEFVEFVKEYAPDEASEFYFLAPYDFYNAEVLVKCANLGLNPDKYLSVEGTCSISAIKSLVSGEPVAEDFCAELKAAVCEANAAFKEGKADGAAINALFVRKKYECLLRVSGRTFLRGFIEKQINAADISVCLRSSDYLVAESMLIGTRLRGGSGAFLTDGQIAALIERDEVKAGKLFGGELKEVVLNSIECAKKGKPLEALERFAGSLDAKKMLEGKYTELSGTQPFVLYCCIRKNEISCVRTVLAGKANGLDVERIKRMLLLV